jgi:hypothetical protein
VAALAVAAAFTESEDSGMVGCRSRIRASNSFKTSGVTALRAYQSIKKICRHVFEETPLKPGYSGWLTASVNPCMLFDLNASFKGSFAPDLLKDEERGF